MTSRGPRERLPAGPSGCRAAGSGRQPLGRLFKAALLSTILSVGSEAGTTNDQHSLTDAIRRGAADSISQTGRQVVGRSLQVQPTVTVWPGFPVRVIVPRDLMLEPYAG